MQLHERFEHALVLLLVAGCAALLVGPAIRLAFYLGIVDRPDKARKLHGKETAYLGGAVLWVALSIAMIALSWFRQDTYVLPAWLAFSLLFMVGLADDAWDLPPWSRLCVQAVSISILLGATLSIPSTPMEWLYAVILLIAGIGVVNAYNLLDGLDGLALGTGLLAATPFFVVSWQGNSTSGVAITLAFLSAGTGLLRGNLYPAKIFLGDAGSLLVGGLIFSLPLYGMQQGGGIDESVLIAFIPIVLGVPCIDMAIVMWGRLRSGSPMFRGDRTHLHHRLQRLGFSHEVTVGIIHLIMTLLVMLQLLINSLKISPLWYSIIAVIWILGYAILYRFEKKNTSIQTRGVHHAA
jgi:UDP-GlcNAc:undecaprenyl-phosphate GlcNAc-1-phosphate transferase